ncbi:MAG: YlmC/YmxH family sporulation protein [Bacillaceae bacterium]|nr:YlmC/YmxH family sporulation protein [Bacillaceae bacterium]
MLKISEIQTKEIINISDGKVLGHLSDIDIDLETGKIEEIIIGGTGKMLSFLGGKETEIVIPWTNIVKIGADVVLVRVESNN